ILGRLDVLTFTAGVGENDDVVRARVCEGLEPLGIVLDPERNAGRGGPKVISAEGAPVTVLVIPTNEELAIARQSLAVVEGR
ncbi:acetate kinase, partial [Listeria monocytogenes]|nr:acetate kinase [Listeria monocytogenes]